MKPILLALLITVRAFGAQTSVASEPSGVAPSTAAQILIEALVIQVPARGSNTLGVSYLGGETPGPADCSFGAGALSRSNMVLVAWSAPAEKTNATASHLSGLTYLATLDNDLDMIVPALASDSRVKILQRPRIQTSSGEPALMFIGEARPDPTSPYYSGGAYSGYAPIQQLRVGVTLELTPFVKPDGFVVMDIHQKIDRFAGSTNIANVGAVPITTSTEVSARVKVRDRETILLGGLIERAKNRNPSGVPVLKDIPLLGAQFRTSSARAEQDEIVVLIRPTVIASSGSVAVPPKARP